MIVRAIRRSASGEIPDPEWYDALSLTREDARFQRAIDQNNRKLQERAASMGVG
jgi:hypothetical protein